MSSGRAVLKKDRLEEERELLRRLLEKEGLGAPSTQAHAASQEQAPISPAEASGTKSRLFPLSCQQEQLWFLDRFQPRSDFYNVSFAWRVNGGLDVPTLERSLQEIVRRHEVLRTCFIVGEDEQPKQKVIDRLDVRLPVLDLRHLPAGAREQQAKEIIAKEGSKAFDLSQVPLLRGVLVRMDDNQHVFGLTLHHIVCDEWSLGLLMEELEKLYEAYRKGEESPLPELEVQYGNYALEQRQELRGGRLQQQMEYWKSQLKGMPQVLELPTDHARPAQQSFRGGMQARNVESSLLEGMTALGRGEGASLFMTSLAVFQVLLMRYTGQEDFGVGASITNRSHTNTHRAIGFFLNTLVMRSNLSRNPSFRDVLRHVRQTALSAYEHQDLPFDKLVEELAPDRDVSRNPLIQVMFTVFKHKVSQFGTFKFEEFDAEIKTSKFDLTMVVQDTEEAKIAFNYSTDLFEVETIQRMSGHYERLLKSAVENPEQRVWELPLLTSEEKDQLQEWSQTSRSFDRRTVAELFEECAARVPDHVAVECRDENLTYGQLNRRANQLAHYLKTIGVKPETRVAIGVQRGLEMVVGIVAVLKAGGAYVPLDLSFPAQRLQFILQDSAPVALLARGDLRDLPGAIAAGIQIVDVENESLYKDLPETNLSSAETGVNSECLAYVIYTSGSTGEPKGSKVPHRSIPGFIFGTDYVHFDEGTVLLQHSSVSWDALTLELWAALLAGGRSVLAYHQRVMRGEEIREYVQDRGVNTLWLTAALLNSIVECDVKCLDGVKYLMTGGETASVSHIRRAIKELPGMRVVNGYGPSECTVFSSCYVVPADLPETVMVLPIGQPIGDRQMYVLDGWMNVSPIGVVGEGFIGGASVARGYLQRPDLTAERFVPDPHGGEAGGRLYRTGDLVRWREYGTIEFVGRNDYQVKVRGFRIELGEIEAIVQQQIGVRGCAVVVKGGANGSNRLVAYVVGERNREELRRDLKSKLPAYMVPSAIVGLQELPLTSNGKLDRQALEKLEDLDGESGEYYEAARTPVEKQVAEIWAAVLKVTQVGRHSNFFDLGGHSLLAVSMGARCRDVFGLDVSIQTIFQSPTVAELAEVIELGLKSQGSELRRGKDIVQTQMSSASRPSVFPLSSQQEQLWFLDRFLPSSDFYNVALAWRVKGDLDVPRLERSMQEVVRRHEILRTCFVMGEDEEPRQKVVGKGLEVRLPLVDLRKLEAGKREKQAKAVIAEEAGKAFDLSQAPMLRGVLVRTGEKEHVLGLTLHHIICDEWSMGVFMEELGELYEAYGRGEESPLPELGMQYGEYALEQREGLRGGKFQQQMEYWKKQLKGMPQVLELPTDHMRRAQQNFRGGFLQRGLESGLIEGLNALGKAEGASPFMTLLAAFQVLLMRYSGQEDFGVGTSITNRSRTSTHGLIGFFLNTLVMRANLGGEPAFREVLRKVRQTALGGYEHQDLPYEKLVEELAPDRDLSRNPLVQVMFTVQRPTDSKFAAFELSEFEADIRTSKFDLSMLVEDSKKAKIALNYSTDLFEEETITRMLGHYEQLLTAVVKNPEQRVWDLPLLTEEERGQLEKWNQTGRDYDRDRNVAELFEECAARIPDAVAAEYEGQKLPYGELNRRANRLAHYLRELGVQAEQRVAICVERGLEMIVGLVAVLKAGGAYVPMDPEYPQEHLRYVLQDSAPVVLLTQEHLRGVWGGMEEKAVVVDINDSGRFSRQPESNLPSVGAGLEAGHLAYLIYTSGSTGQPKGVMVSHRNLASATFARKLTYGELGRFLLLSSISFDSSVAGIFGCLVYGGTLIIAPRDVVHDPLLLNQEVQRLGVESLLCVPSLYRHFLEYPIRCEPKKLSRVIVAGEVCPLDLVAKSAEKEPQVELFNEYGPTEGTVWATVHRCIHPLSEQSVPIGHPIANARIHIVDARREPVPIGVVGELHIGGAGVARGYWNRPELTAENFVPDPLAGDVTARMYKTGDLGRWRPNGTIEFIGRNDSQVKIRGYRVELEEIERVLRGQVAVEEAVVSARDDRAGGKQLVAYVVEKSQEKRLPEEGKDFSGESKRVGEFTQLYDDLYGRDEAYAYADPGVNVRIWSSSYTNQPLREEEIAESVTQAVKSIRDLGGRRVLEIGCGTGLLLSRIASHCDAYCGLDVSAEALRRLRAQLGEKPEFSHVMLREGAAHQLEGLDAERFDCVVLNDVAQHFPDMDYLLTVLKKAAELVEPRGTIFLGGMRNLHLLEAFHGSVQLFQARDSMRLEELRRRIRHQMQSEKDLIVAPEFFAGVKVFLPQVTAAQVQLKRGQHRNEITCFKYDVVLYVGYERVDSVDRQEKEWEAEKWSVRELERWVREQSPDVVRIKGIANARLAKEKGLLELLERKNGKAGVAEIRQDLDQWAEKESGIDPEDFLSLEHRVPYQVEVSWAGGGHDGAYDVILKKRSLLSGGFVVVQHGTGEEGRREEAQAAAAEFANHPMAEGRFNGPLSRELVEELRRGLKEKLPEHMIPSVFMKLESLPLTANGKVDRQALPEVGELELGEGGEQYEAPRAGVEEQLAEIWTAVLRVTRAGRHDHFFRSGGHSLLATSMAARFRNVFGIDVPVRAIFESPTIAELAEVIERGLKLLGIKSGDKVIARTPVRSTVRPSLFPLSYQQEQLWFLDRFEPSSDFYNVPLAWSFMGDLDVPRLERSLQEVVRRHEILRTCFVVGEDEEPKQKVVDKGIEVRLPVLDLRKLEEGEREEQARKVLAKEGSKAFDLSRTPLLRAVLVRTGEREHVLGLTLHHIICDDWSLGVLMSELGKLYEAYGRGEESPLPELSMQYGEYALEQREGGRFQEQMEYWKGRLKGMPQVLELPTDHVRPVRQSFRGENEQRIFSGELLDGLNGVGRGEKASLFMTMLAVLQVLLMRYAGQEDFGVGTPVANRKRIETEPMVGFFLNTLVIRANLGGEPTFGEVLRRVREAAFGGYEHQDLAFEKLVEELAPDRDVSRTPIFQVMFTSLGEPDKLEFGDLEVGGFGVDLDMSKFDLTMSVNEIGQGAGVTINYATDLFERETIQRMLGHYERLLKAVVENPVQRVWHLPLLTGPEIKQLETWNQTARDYARGKTIAGLFEENAARTPNAVAVEYEQQELKYGDLNREANRLAHYLRALGVRPDTLVAVCVDRSLEMVVGLLAVMKAGGAFVPLDPAYPGERLRFMLEDSRPAVLLTQGHLRGQFTGIREDLRVIDLGSTEAWSDQPGSNPEHTSGLTTKDLAYVIYTSGSTGMPKGVAMPLRAATNMIAWQMNESISTEPQRTLQFAALGFDVSFQEIFSTLGAGGCLVLIDEEKRRNSADLTRYVVEKGIQRLFLPYVGLRMLAEGVAQKGAALKEGESFDCALQEINVAGEQLRIDDKIRGLFKRLAHCRLNNHYGPTETHAASAFHLNSDKEQWPLLPPIGQPIANAQIYILDKHEQLVPLGVTGELYIGGAGVARGYFNRPELTEKRFLEDRFAKEEGARMYRSGDLGRWRPDGTIEFIGRNDSQVKIRGYRVELGEIEAMLQQQSGVRGCAVVAKTGVNGSKRLVAYVVGERESEELRRDLKGKLPAYMVPSVIVALPELPLSGNGKVDREALEKLEDLGLGAEHYEAPRTAIEEQLAKIWAEALEITRVGRLDNFFDLGGHSLLATLLATRMENTFEIGVPVRAIFESPTIAELADVIELGLKVQGRKLAGDNGVARAAIASATRPSFFPLSYQQEQLWFLDRFNPGNAFYNIPLTWKLKGDLDVSRLERSLQEVVRRHEILRTCFVMGEDEEPRQKVVGERLDVPLPVEDLRVLERGEREEKAKKVLMEDAGKAFDLDHAPLLRGVLVRTEDREHILELTLHHIICDDWSLGVLMEELGKLYAAYERGEKSPLPELGMQYGEYALEQREGLRSGRFQQQMEYWKGQLKGMPQVLELPTDHVRPARESFRGGTEQRILRSALVDGLNTLGREEKASLLMILLAAFQVLLMRYSGQDDFGVGTVVANRKRNETKGLIGFFLNTLVIRANLGGEPTFREVLRRVREAVLGGYEHQDLAFEKLVEELAPDRDVSRSPVFQVAFTLRRAIAGKSDFGGLELVPFGVDPGTSKFDLILGVEEARQSATVGLNYTTDLFEAKSIRHMLEHYERLLEGIVADVDQPVWALPMMSKLDEKVLSNLNGTGLVSDTEKNIIEIFEAQAECTPQEPVVIFGETKLSYAELNRRANQVAHYLARMGVTPESPVGIFMPHSQEMMVALLGVLKAGGAYLPLDVLNPKERLRSMIDSSGTAILLTLEGLRKRLPQTNARVLLLDSEWEVIGQQVATNPEVQINPQNRACVIYTAASEGHAKGLVIEHNGLMDLVSAREDDPITQNGHAGENRFPELWPRLTSSSFLAGTSAFRTLVEEGQRTTFRPNGNAEIYILDPHLQRVAIGVPGELWIAGPAAGRGYLGLPSLTAEKFRPNPFKSEMGARMYGSGERARYREDGTVELMGRLDDRTEIEGFPVELGEIETALANYESVREAVVVVRPNGELVAYVVVSDGKRLGQNELRSYLDSKLPAYMIPSAFITLQELPQNARGKVDRAALSVLGQEQLTGEFVPPRTELEQTIASAWQGILGVDQVGVHDNFFDLGGHSLLMIQLHQKLRAELPVQLELLHLFQFPTIDALVRFLHTGYNFDGKSRETRERAGRQKGAVQKLRRMHTP